MTVQKLLFAVIYLCTVTLLIHSQCINETEWATSQDDCFFFFLSTSLSLYGQRFTCTPFFAWGCRQIDDGYALAFNRLMLSALFWCPDRRSIRNRKAYIKKKKKAYFVRIRKWSKLRDGFRRLTASGFSFHRLLSFGFDVCFPLIVNIATVNRNIERQLWCSLEPTEFFRRNASFESIEDESRFKNSLFSSSKNERIEIWCSIHLICCEM